MKCVRGNRADVLITIDSDHAQFAFIPLCHRHLHALSDRVGPRAGCDVAFRQVAPGGARTFARAGAPLFRRAPLLALPGGGAGACRPEPLLRHRAEPSGDDRYSGPLLRAAQLPLGLQARGVPHPLLRPVPASARRYLHRPRTRLGGDGAAAARRPAVDLARGVGGDIPRRDPLEGRGDPSLQGRSFRAGPQGRGGDSARGAGRHDDAREAEPAVQLAQHDPGEGAGSRARRAGSRNGYEGADGRCARTDGRSAGGDQKRK